MDQDRRSDHQITYNGHQIRGFLPMGCGCPLPDCYCTQAVQGRIICDLCMSGTHGAHDIFSQPLPNGVRTAAEIAQTEYTLNPWKPETRPRALAVLGKLGEEGGELVSAVNRCIIQGVDECEPVSGKLNRRWLTEEIADVLASVDRAIEYFRLDTLIISARRQRKYTHLSSWHELVDDA